MRKSLGLLSVHPKSLQNQDIHHTCINHLMIRSPESFKDVVTYLDDGMQLIHTSSLAGLEGTAQCPRRCA